MKFHHQVNKPWGKRLINENSSTKTEVFIPLFVVVFHGVNVKELKSPEFMLGRSSSVIVLYLRPYLIISVPGRYCSP